MKTTVTMKLLVSLLLALLCATAPVVRASGDPFEELTELYVTDTTSTTLNSDEVQLMFDDLQSLIDTGHPANEHAHSEAKSTLTVAEIITEHGSSNALTEDQFKAACPEILVCAVEDTCTFDTTETTGSMDYVGLKMGLAVVIFVEALIGGLLPLFFIKNLAKADSIMSLLNAFSGGVFITAGLTHILPHVVESQADVDDLYNEYPLAYALVVIGFIMIFLVERVIFHAHGHSAEEEEGHSHGHSHSKSDEKYMVGLVDGDSVKKATKEGFKTSLVILLAISLHAILAGVSMGIQSESENVYTVFVAIASHKAPAAFSIGSKFIRNGMDAKTVVSLIVVFSLVTPVGIIIGFLVGSTSAVARLVLEGLAAGTFIYIGATEVTADEFEMTARACSKLHSGAAAGAATVHTHKTHEVPGMAARLVAFGAYAFGCLVILLANLAPHYD
ncbi:zinc permease family [Micromonas pusilla CCMP1545]|jgi:zinc transporter 1/2/3|uniref:Zinc permease family n=1 Tax=Micromonas pusilla (strain CCMP1545) TaxID=564608 RepID=C1N069_MICPC|nr:zinc permease family [Micromonas pusilla CCMP1545]EEH54992.1 zinc permease family [Micromonas pusilla CCMP1545]|tara:strand:+ start:530 stop:1864 length:1335 start_codon:yes stop_codon:yes gene_type:complete|eukprot:XP_003061342.1 zinc permease family [Micromonas pusilla CCMP1545]